LAVRELRVTSHSLGLEAGKECAPEVVQGLQSTANSSNSRGGGQGKKSSDIREKGSIDVMMVRSGRKNEKNARDNKRNIQAED